MSETPATPSPANGKRSGGADRRKSATPASPAPATGPNGTSPASGNAAPGGKKASGKAAGSKATPSGKAVASGKAAAAGKPAASGKAAPGGRPAANLSADSVPPVAAAASGSFRWAVRVLYAEAVATGFVTLALIWLALAADNVSASSAIATVAFAALCAAILAGLATALARRKSLARGPAIVVQMLLVVIGGYMIAGGLAWLGVPVLVVGLFGSGLLLAPSTRATLGLD